MNAFVDLGGPMTRISRITLCLSLSSMVVIGQDARPEPVKLEPETISGLGIRNIGPAVMAGRISAMDGVHEKGRTTLYVGAASGGVWKSVNGGTTFKPVFDKHNQSIGAIRIDPKDPKTVWAGTGETWVRNSVSLGDGLYKTTDGGENWSLMGLPDSERIAAIEVDPTDSNTVYVAAMGHLWNSNDERGLYKTSDGGKTWKRILFINGDTGCASLVLDPKDPKIIYASMWQYRRKPWAFESGGPGSGLFKSTDGGATWTRLSEGASRGLPSGDLGRI
ncbi:MAG: glycosyl hydrolase, partial [Acidobacteriota bacterium]|nr:glycosyl hydrolase [Acidobacteriota bacterium]